MTEPATPTVDDLHCPVCEYALRGLPEPRCPECGYAFEWAELLEQTRLRQGWFYEHAGTFKSHLRTRWRSLRPKKFWGDIHAYTLANSRRLWRYRGTTLAVLILLSAVAVSIPALLRLASASVSGAGYNSVITATTLPAGSNHVVLQMPTTQRWVPAPTTNAVAGPATRPRSRRSMAAPSTGGSTQFPGYVLVPVPPAQQQYVYYLPLPAWRSFLQRFAMDRWVTKSTDAIACDALITVCILVLLPIYWRLLRGSVMRANILPVHLARVDAYSTDVLPLLVLLATLAELAWQFVFFGSYRYAFQDYWLAICHTLLTPLIVGVGLTVRLSSALRRYVRFPHARGVAYGFMTILVLAWVIVRLQMVPL